MPKDPCNCEQALELLAFVKLLVHAAESAVLEEPCPVLRAAIEFAYEELDVPPAGPESDCDCDACQDIEERASEGS